MHLIHSGKERTLEVTYFENGNTAETEIQHITAESQIGFNTGKLKAIHVKMKGKGQFLGKYIDVLKVAWSIHLLLIFCYGATISMQQFTYTEILILDHLNQIRNFQQIFTLDKTHQKEQIKQGQPWTMASTVYF